MRLVVVQQTPGPIRVVAAFAPAEGIGDPAKETVAEFLAQQRLYSIAAPDTVLGQ